MITLLQKNKPLFLKFIKEDTLTPEEHSTLNVIVDELKELLYDTAIPAGKHPITYVYINYCDELLQNIECSESAGAAYDFISGLVEPCKNKELAEKFGDLAAEAFGSFSTFKMDEFYDTLLESYKENNANRIEDCVALLARLQKEAPSDMHLQARNNLLFLMLTKWDYYQLNKKLSLLEHTSNVLEINSRFDALLQYHCLSNKLSTQLAILWNKWFINFYVLGFFIRRLDSMYNTNSADEIAAIKMLDEEQQSGFDQIINDLLLKCIDTCIIKSRVSTHPNNTGSQKKLKNSDDFIFRNIGNIELMELNIGIIFGLLSQTEDSQLVLLQKLMAILPEFLPHASREWLTQSHRTINYLTTRPVLESEVRLKTMEMYIEISQLLEHQYYDRTGGKYMPPPPRSYLPRVLHGD